MINRCHLYLWLLSISDMLTYDLKSIHPSYRTGDHPPSRVSTIYWPNLTNPPRHYWKLWHHFLRFHLDPLISSATISWCPNPPLRHKIIFFKRRHFFHLYRVIDTDVTEFRLAPRNRRHRTTFYINTPYFTEICHDDPNLIPVDAYFTEDGLIV